MWWKLTGLGLIAASLLALFFAPVQTVDVKVGLV
jgi:hypothetical protein